jgi:hypothetical protein
MAAPMLAPQHKSLIPAPMAFKLFLNVVAYFKAHGLPEIYTRKAVPKIIPDNLRYRTRLSLRSLNLITDDRRVLKSFHELVKAWDTPHWLGVMQALIRNAYPFMADQDLTAMSAAKLHTMFVAHVGKDSTILSKSEMFFLNLAAAAGLELSDSLQRRVETSAARSTTDTAPAAPKKTAAKVKAAAPVTKPAPDASRKAAYLIDTNVLAELLGKLPPFDQAWSEEMKAKWLDSYGQLTTTLTKNSTVDKEFK